VVNQIAKLNSKGLNARIKKKTSLGLWPEFMTVPTNPSIIKTPR
jgi:hypothetical protein